MLPLSGVRILAVEQYGAGPFGSMQLADMGAEVIKIENPAEGGDVSRSIGPYFLGENDSHFFQAFNRNKRSVTLNLRAPGGQQVLRDLAAHADGVLDNLRGDQPARLGVTYDALKAANPRIVCAHLSAYGRTGSRANWPGYDYLMQAEAGYLSLTGEPDSPPARFGLSVIDLMAGVYAATALLGGILSARATGMGRDVDVSLFDTALSNLNYVGAWFLNEGRVQGREPRGVPSVADAQPAVPHRGWLDLHHVQQAEVLAGAVREDRPPRMVRRPALLLLRRAAGPSRAADGVAGRSADGARHGCLAGALRRRRARRAGARCGTCADVRFRAAGRPRVVLSASLPAGLPHGAAGLPLPGRGHAARARLRRWARTRTRCCGRSATRTIASPRYGPRA